MSCSAESLQFTTLIARVTCKDITNQMFQQAVQRMPDEAQHKWLRAYAASERLSRHLGSLSQRYTEALQPTADTLGSALGLPDQATNMFAEEVIRGTAAAPLAQLLAVLNPLLRELAGLPNWQPISPGHGECNCIRLLCCDISKVCLPAKIPGVHSQRRDSSSLLGS